MTKVFVKIVEEDEKKSVLFGTEKDVPEWEKQFRDWEKQGFSTYYDKIEEVGTTDDIETLLANINQQMKDNYDPSF